MFTGSSRRSHVGDYVRKRTPAPTRSHFGAGEDTGCGRESGHAGPPQGVALRSTITSSVPGSPPRGASQEGFLSAPWEAVGAQCLPHGQANGGTPATKALAPRTSRIEAITGRIDGYNPNTLRMRATPATELTNEHYMFRKRHRTSRVAKRPRLTRSLGRLPRSKASRGAAADVCAFGRYRCHRLRGGGCRGSAEARRAAATSGDSPAVAADV